MQEKLPTQIISQIRSYFEKQPHVIAVYLFGSYAKSTAHALSDIDLAVLFDKKHTPKDLTEMRLVYLRDLSQRLQVDTLDIQILTAKSSLPFLEQILRSHKLVLNKDPRQRIEFENQMRFLYFDFEPLLNQYVEAMYDRLERGTYGYRQKTT